MMIPRRLMILPGASSGSATTKYRQVYAAIEQGANERGFVQRYVSYPGHDGINSGRLSLANACENVLAVAKEFRPTWIVARSLGCDVAAAVLSSCEDWVGGCEVAILWGPCMSRDVRLSVQNPEVEAALVASYEKFGTYLAPNVLSTLPALEEAITAVRCNLRIARGGDDQDNCLQDLELLSELHRRGQPCHNCEVMEITGVGHEVTPSNTAPDVFKKYLDCIFDPVATR